jgi:PAS domain S-box-containing protein
MAQLSTPPATLSIRKKLFLGFGIALLMMVLVAMMADRSTAALLRTAESVNRTRTVLEAEGALLRWIAEAESAVRGYLIAPGEGYFAMFEEAAASVDEHVKRLKSLCTEDRRQAERIEQIGAIFSRSASVFREIMRVRQEQGLDAAISVWTAKATRPADEIAAYAGVFEQTERETLRQRADLTSSIGRVTRLSVVSATALTLFLLTIACPFILRDIAARRRAEEALAAEHHLLGSVMDAIPEHVFVKDTAGRYVTDNTAHRAFLGMDAESSVEGLTVFDFFPREIGEMYEATDNRVLETAEPLLDLQEPSVDREGRLRWLSTTKVPLRDIDGRLIGLVGVSTDISQRKRADEELRFTAAQLERSNRDLNDFAAVASHDLQEPLRKILAFGDRLRSKFGASLGADATDYLSRMMNAAERMQRLIQDLLTLSRVTSRAQPFMEVDLHAVLQEVVSDLEVRIEQCGAKIEVGRLPTIDADPLQMRQLFQNLLSNALKFQKPGECPVVQISGKVLEVPEPQIPGAAPGDLICTIVVRDNGIGFDQKFAEKIFTVFQRLHGRLEYEGTGIGLAVVRKIADRHGGSVSAKSTEGEGATFIVTLPVKQRMKLSQDEAR